MATEAKAVINGGFAFLDAGRVLHVLSEKKEAEKDAATGKVEAFLAQHAYGYPVVPAGDQYEQLVITIAEDGGLTEKFGRDIPAHVKAVAAKLK
ncbi:hypothetical protein [Paenibacillus kandeliae]|uniref:hypothetical protein n=1 Tax=Paenibacillus kandeliae TaxID=3231269 RepID=UPI00345791E4